MDYDWVYSKLFNGTIRWWCLVHVILDLRLVQHLKKNAFISRESKIPVLKLTDREPRRQKNTWEAQLDLFY